MKSPLRYRRALLFGALILSSACYFIAVFSSRSDDGSSFGDVGEPDHRIAKPDGGDAPSNAKPQFHHSIKDQLMQRFLEADDDPHRDLLPTTDCIDGLVCECDLLVTGVGQMLFWTCRDACGPGRDFVGFHSQTIICPSCPLSVSESCNVTGCGKVPDEYKCFDIFDEWTCEDVVCGFNFSNCTLGSMDFFAWLWCLVQNFFGGIFGFLGGIFGIFG